MTETRRSIPSVDPLPAREELAAMAIVSDRAQLSALDRVHIDLALQRSTLDLLKWLLVAVIVLVVCLTAAVSAVAIVGANRIDSVERRVERLERFHSQETSP